MTKQKPCKQCGVEFAPKHGNMRYCSTECSKIARSRRGRRWALEHKESVRESSRKWRAKNRARSRETSRRWREENRERHLKLCQEWASENPGRLREGTRKWRAANPDKVGAASARRASIELAGNASYEDIEAKWEAGDQTCCLCGTPIDPDLPSNHREGRTLEHLTPIMRGGRHDIDNLDFAHRSCNSSKGNMTLEEYKAWLASQGERS